MVDIKEAVTRAKAFAEETLGIEDPLLEELGSDDSQFEVTLSFPKRMAAGETFLASYRGREFKTFDIDKRTGAVLGMKIRKL